MKNIVVMAALAAATGAGAEGPTLESLVRAALEDSPQVAAASARVDAARGALEQARSAWWPVISASGGHARTDNPPQAFMMALNQRALNMADPSFNPNRPDHTGNTRFSLGAKIRLADFGRRVSGRRAAEAMTGAQEAMETAARNDLVHEVTRGYYTVLQAQAFAAVQAEMVASLEESLRVARERFERGAAVKSDVLGLEVRLAQAREDLIRAKNGIQLSIAALNTAVGREMVSDRGLAVQPPETVPDSPADPAPGEEASHPAVRAAEAAVAARRHAVAGARAEWRPTLNAFGTLDWDSEELSDFQDSYMAGVMAEWDLFDGFRRRGALREAEANLAEAEADARRAADGVRLDLRQATLQAREARERWAVTEKSVESAAEALRIVKARYEQGAADLADLLNAEVGLSALRSRSVAALYDVLVALSNIGRARGTLVESSGVAGR